MVANKFQNQPDKFSFQDKKLQQNKHKNIYTTAQLPKSRTQANGYPPLKQGFRAGTELLT